MEIRVKIDSFCPVQTSVKKTYTRISCFADRASVLLLWVNDQLDAQLRIIISLLL